jgi:hypothetical protein
MPIYRDLSPDIPMPIDEISPLEMNMMLPEPNALQRKMLPKREPLKTIFGFPFRFQKRDF